MTITMKALPCEAIERPPMRGNPCATHRVNSQVKEPLSSLKPTARAQQRRTSALRNDNYNNRDQQHERLQHGHQQHQDAATTTDKKPGHPLPYTAHPIPYTPPPPPPPIFSCNEKKLITIWYGFSQRLTIGHSTALATKTQSTVDSEGPIKGTKFSIRPAIGMAQTGPRYPAIKEPAARRDLRRAQRGRKRRGKECPYEGAKPLDG